ncbi:E3 ubiquitin-protein ligase sina-like [Epargyreus clarus]|uniref:E3 ubiquitin-protein ligase sina-like n=1 Tax=Epargyreus clarus TaxID=520877 RepID=UPI003C2B7FA7
MGSEQSTERKSKDESQNQRMIQQILEQQRRIYEEKCKEMIQQQQKTAAVKEDKPLPARNPHQNANSVSQTPTNAYAPLYPNLQQTQHVQPSTSSYNASNISNIPSNTRASTPRGVQHSNTNYMVQPSAPAVPFAVEPTQSRPSAQKKYQSGDWMCISCNKTLGTKIFNCTEGHSSCSDCKFKGVKCGICRNWLTDVRNISLENYIAENKPNIARNTEVLLSCPNKIDGCKLSLKQDRMENHIKECPYREMTCPVVSLYPGCSWQGKINHFREHFVECHPEVTRTDLDTEANYNINDRKHVIHHVVLGNFNFLVHLKLDSQALYMAVQLIGSRNIASNCTYEFNVYDKTDLRRELVYTDTCLPSSIPFDNVCNEATCAVLQYQYAMSFVKNNKLTYKFSIKKDIKSQVKRGGPKQRGLGGQN